MLVCGSKWFCMCMVLEPNIRQLVSRGWWPWSYVCYFSPLSVSRHSPLSSLSFASPEIVAKYTYPYSLDLQWLAFQYLERMKILRNQCSDSFYDTSEYVTTNAYLTLPRGSRYFLIFSACLLLPPLCVVCGCDAWKCDVKQNATPNVKILSHLHAIWMLLCKLAKEVFSRDHLPCQ